MKIKSIEKTYSFFETKQIGDVIAAKDLVNWYMNTLPTNADGKPIDEKGKEVQRGVPEGFIKSLAKAGYLKKVSKGMYAYATILPTPDTEEMQKSKVKGTETTTVIKGGAEKVYGGIITDDDIERVNSIVGKPATVSEVLPMGNKRPKDYPIPTPIPQSEFVTAMKSPINSADTEDDMKLSLSVEAPYENKSLSSYMSTAFDFSNMSLRTIISAITALHKTLRYSSPTFFRNAENMSAESIETFYGYKAFRLTILSVMYKYVEACEKKYPGELIPNIYKGTSSSVRPKEMLKFIQAEFNECGVKVE